MGLFEDFISGMGKAVNAPVLFDWNSQAARDDVAANNGKRTTDSAAFAAVNKDKEYSRANGKIYNYAGDVIGTYPTNNTGEAGTDGTGGVSYSDGGSGAASRAAQAFYDSGISSTQSLIDSLGGREASALASLMQSYLSTKGRQDVEYGDNESDYNKTTDKITRDDARKKTQIDSNVRNDMSNLSRLLGARGAGSSSAKDVVARQVAGKGSSDRADASQVTADNMDVANTNWDRYRRSWEQNRADTDADYSNNQNDIKSQFAQQGIDARQKLLELQTNRAAAGGGDAGAIAKAAGTTGEINALQQKINDLAARTTGRVVTSKDVTMDKSEQKDFNDPSNTSTAQAGGQAQDDTGAYYDPNVQKKSDEDLLKELFGIQ